MLVLLARAWAVQFLSSLVHLPPLLHGQDLVPLPPSCTVYLVQGEGDRYSVQIPFNNYSKRNKSSDRAPGSMFEVNSDATTTMPYLLFSNLFTILYPVHNNLLIFCRISHLCSALKVAQASSSEFHRIVDPTHTSI
jgi:hypothetical protein